MIIKNDPIKTMIKATKNLYPETEALIEYFASPEFKIEEDRVEDERFSSITFPKDNDIPLIKISGNVPFDVMTVLLCRQLTSAVMREPIKIDREWEQQWIDTFQRILDEYNRLLG